MIRAQAEFSANALIKNYKLISAKVPHLKMIPMIKANAYGHGAVWAAKTLLPQKNLYAFGVATFDEAIEIRAEVKRGPPILVFSDTAPWSQDRLQLCRKLNLEPVFSEIVSLLEFQKQKNNREVPFHVEVNTGMNRLGIPAESLSLIRQVPKSVFTHLADADEPGLKLTQFQIKKFTEVVAFIAQKFPTADLHFANSSTIWNHKRFPLLEQMTVARPGLSLYGIRPFAKAKEDGLKRVMTFSAPVLNKIYLNPGDQVGYGGTYTCKKRGGEWVSVLGAGYADGVFRSLSGCGIGVYAKSKQRVSFLGRVSMDLSAVQGSPKVQIGDRVILWGDAIDPYEQAHLAGTIPYELTTRVGPRIERVEKA
jgi:alanine racemase